MPKKRPGDPSKLVANINYAETLLHYQPRHDIMSILETAYKWQNKK
jgi:UDP-glucose 4-epimerase